MAKRRRQISKNFYVSEAEEELIKKGMAETHINSFSDYARKMCCNGYIVNVDFTEIKELTAQIQGLSNNFNQIVKRVNTKDQLYEDDIKEMRELMEKIWHIQKRGLSSLL